MGKSMKIYGGLIFGKLTVINETKDKPTTIKDKAYLCSCECGKYRIMGASKIRRSVKENSVSSCGLCYTFEDWCLDNNHQDYLDLWDYELNDKKPSEISYSVGLKFYFKCDRRIHESELWKIDSVVNKKSKDLIKCRRCSSFGQYLIDTYGKDAIEKYWSKNNKLNPFEISRYYEGSKHNRKKVVLICPACGCEKEIRTTSFIRQGISCNICSDKKSYPEKVAVSVLNQLEISFIPEYSPEWAIVDFRGRKRICRYDFYIPSKKIIIEVDGGLGHGNTIHKSSDMTIDESLYIDNEKDSIARKQGLDVIRVDCLHSNIEYIKTNMIKSMDSYFDLSNIDWDKCDEFATNSLVKHVCDLWMTRSFKSANVLSESINISRGTVKTYLKQGAKIGWCDYDPKEEHAKTGRQNGKNTGFDVEVFKDGVYMGTFPSCGELSRMSEDRFGVKFYTSAISMICNDSYGKSNTHKGFTFRYSKNKL